MNNIIIELFFSVSKQSFVAKLDFVYKLVLCISLDMMLFQSRKGFPIFDRLDNLGQAIL